MMDNVERAERLRDRFDAVLYRVLADDASGALGQLGAAWEEMSELAPELVAMGIRAGMTQKRIADLLGIPASTLRGAKREFAA